MFGKLYKSETSSVLASRVCFVKIQYDSKSVLSTKPLAAELAWVRPREVLTAQRPTKCIELNNLWILADSSFLQQELPYFSIDNARVIYTKMF